MSKQRRARSSVFDVQYGLNKPEGGWREISSFTDVEKRKLRPIAETLAMLDGNAFFTWATHYEQYLPEADALYQSNGGDNGWAGEASFVKGMIAA